MSQRLQRQQQPHQSKRQQNDEELRTITEISSSAELQQNYNVIQKQPEWASHKWCEHILFGFQLRQTYVRYFILSGQRDMPQGKIQKTTLCLSLV